MDDEKKWLRKGRILPEALASLLGIYLAGVWELSTPHPCWDDAPRKHSLSSGRLSAVPSWEDVAPGLKYPPQQPSVGAALPHRSLRPAGAPRPPRRELWGCAWTRRSTGPDQP